MTHQRGGAAGLFALAIGGFGIGVTEFAPMGMLPAIAADLRVSIPAAGLLISAYALDVMIVAPLTTWGGEHLGWRASFWGIAALGVLTMAALRLTLPPQPAPAGSDPRAELRVLARGNVLAALALTVLGSSAMFTVFSYIAPILGEMTRASLNYVTAMLVAYGLRLTAGNWVGGRYADRSVDRTLIAALGGARRNPRLLRRDDDEPVGDAYGHLRMGCGELCAGSPLQVRVMSAAGDAPNLASAVSIGAFNLGNAIGAALGGGVIAAGLG